MSRRARTIGILSDKLQFVEHPSEEKRVVEAGNADGSSALSAQREQQSPSNLSLMVAEADEDVRAPSITWHLPLDVELWESSLESLEGS
jgi:hypothetical protein